MTETGDLSPSDPEDTEITLGLLSAVEQNSAVTQRSLAKDLGIALGLANAYLKRCIKKGMVKVNMAPANRYAYYLTPHGFAEKSRLTARYLTISFNFFRATRDQCAEIYDICAERRWRRIVLAGTSDLTEIAVLCAADKDVTLVGIIDPGANEDNFAGLRVVRRLKDLGAFDAVVLTDFTDPQRAFDTLVESIAPERVLTPPLLKVSRTKPVLAE